VKFRKGEITIVDKTEIRNDNSIRDDVLFELEVNLTSGRAKKPNNNHQRVPAFVLQPGRNESLGFNSKL
jgi:hypothetical protein